MMKRSQFREMFFERFDDDDVTFLYRRLLQHRFSVEIITIINSRIQFIYHRHNIASLNTAHLSINSIRTRTVVSSYDR